MTDDVYKKIKRQNGERFAQTLRNHHNGLLTIDGIAEIVRFAGRDAEPLLPYLMRRLARNDDTPQATPGHPFDLLAAAGYDAFHADDLKKQNSIKKYFAPGELLCTFNDASRHERYHIVHAVKKDARHIHRADFTGHEDRQDAYGTSVLSIQILKTGGFISIKNRYNHAVDGCDHTFDSNPDNIIPGLSSALKAHFNVTFDDRKTPLPAGYVLMNGQIFKYHGEHANIYYGDQAWAKDGVIHPVNRAAGDALFGTFVFDNRLKELVSISLHTTDTFAHSFNTCYRGDKNLHVRDGNLMLGDRVLIGADASQIKSLYLPGLQVLRDHSLDNAPTLESINAPDLISMGHHCLRQAPALTAITIPALVDMGENCLVSARSLQHFHAPRLTRLGLHCLHDVRRLQSFQAPRLIALSRECLDSAPLLTDIHLPQLRRMEPLCLYNAPSLVTLSLPQVIDIGDYCLSTTPRLKQAHLPVLRNMGAKNFRAASSLRRLDTPALERIGYGALALAPKLAVFNAPVLRVMDDENLTFVKALTRFDAPLLQSMGNQCLRHAQALTHINAPQLEVMGYDCLSEAGALTTFNAPKLRKAPAGITKRFMPPPSKNARPGP